MFVDHKQISKPYNNWFKRNFVVIFIIIMSSKNVFVCFVAGVSLECLTFEVIQGSFVALV